MSWKENLIIFGVISPLVTVLAEKISSTVGNQNMTFNLTPFEWIATSISLASLGLWLYFRKSKKQTISTESNSELEKRPFITKRDAKTLDWLDDVKTEVCVLAVDGGSFAESNFERIKKRINQDDVSFTFLLLNPSSDILSKAEGTLLSPEAKTGIESQLKRFKNIRKELGNKMSKLEIKTYDLPIVHSIFIIDPKTNDGKMTVEYYEYKTEPRDKINVILTKKDNPEVFEQYYNSYKYIFENSKTHIFEE